MKLEAVLINSRRHTAIPNNSVFHLAELGRSHGFSAGCIRVRYADGRHVFVLLVWRWAVTAGMNNLAP
jgi:hypothetical protein